MNRHEQHLARLQRDYDEHKIMPVPCPLHPDLLLLTDYARGNLRLHYLLIEQAVVKASVVFVRDELAGAAICFNVGYAVAPPFRERGLATLVLTRAIAEVGHMLNGTMKNFYLAAIVSAADPAAQAVAQRVLSVHALAVTDPDSGKPAFQYVRFFG